MFRRVRAFGVGLACGATVGAGLTLVLTPQSGQALRQQARQHIQTALHESTVAADTTRHDLQQQLAAKISQSAET